MPPARFIPSINTLLLLVSSPLSQDDHNGELLHSHAGRPQCSRSGLDHEKSALTIRTISKKKEWRCCIFTREGRGRRRRRRFVVAVRRRCGEAWDTVRMCWHGCWCWYDDSKNKPLSAFARLVAYSRCRRRARRHHSSFLVVPLRRLLLFP